MFLKNLFVHRKPSFLSALTMIWNRNNFKNTPQVLELFRRDIIFKEHVKPIFLVIEFRNFSWCSYFICSIAPHSDFFDIQQHSRDFFSEYIWTTEVLKRMLLSSSC